jgi:hypothetical protein
MSVRFLRGNYVNDDLPARRLRIDQRNYYTRIPAGNMFNGIRTNDDFVNPALRPPVIGVGDLRVTTTVTDRLRTRLATVIPTNANNDDRFTQINRIVANMTREQALATLLDDLPEWSSKYVYFFDITMRRLLRNDQRDEGVFTTTLHDGRAPILCAPHAEVSLEAPHLRSQTCVQDLLQKYTKECKDKTTEQITHDIAQTWAKHRTEFRSRTDFIRVFDVVLSGTNVNHKRDLLALFDYEALDRIQNNEINAAHLVVWCFYHRVQLSILDFNLNMACRVLLTSQRDSNKKALMVVIANGHVYSIVGKTMRKQVENMRERGCNKLCEKVDERRENDGEQRPLNENELAARDAIMEKCEPALIINEEHKLRELVLGIRDHTKPVDKEELEWMKQFPSVFVHTTLDLHTFIARMYQDHHMLPLNKYVKSTGSTIASVKMNGAFIVHDDNPEQVKRLYEAVNDPMYHPADSSLSKITQTLFQVYDNQRIWKMSCFNDVAKSFMEQAVLKPAIVNRYDRTRHPYTRTVDVRRCYTSVLGQCKQWLKANVMNDVRPYSGEIRPDTLYYVDTTLNNFLLSGAGLYTEPIITRAKQAYMISDDDITCELRCQVVSFDFEPFIAKVYDLFTDHDAKDVINRFIGSMNMSTSKTSNMTYTNSKSDVAKYYALLNAIGYKKVLECEKDLYCVHRCDEQACYYTNRLNYIQIIQTARCQMYDLSLQTQTGIVVQCKTDSLTIAYTSEQERANDVPLRITSLPFAQIGALRESQLCDAIKHTPSTVKNDPYHFVPPQVTHVQHPTPDELFDLLMNSKGNVFVSGKGGAGKSTSAQRVYEALIEQKRKVIRTSFQHITCERIGEDAITNHRVFGINVDGQNTQPVELGGDVLMMDEISMTPSEMYNHLNRIHTLCPNTRILAFGHYAQLYPVGEEHVNIENSHVFNTIFPTQVYLEGRFRSPDEHELHVIQDDVEAGTYDPDTLRERINQGRSEPVGADVHIVVSNVVRKQINARLNKGKKGVQIPWTSDTPDPHFQPYVLHPGLRVMRVNKDESAKYKVSDSSTRIKKPKKKGASDDECPIKRIANGSMFEVESYTDKTVTLVRLQDFEKTSVKVVLPFDATKFGYLFTIAWAMTVYKAQGCNINRPHVLHEFHKIQHDKRYVYTSITRTTKQAHLYIAKF